MGNNIELSTFPSTTAEALAILYLQKQDLSNASQNEIAEKYWEAYNIIRDRLRELRHQGK